MPHMLPVVERGAWFVVECDDGGSEVIPVDVAGEVGGDLGALAMYCEAAPVAVERREAWGARLSAPGYMDCTSWTLHDTEAEARADLRDTHDVCPWTGAELPSDPRAEWECDCGHCDDDNDNGAGLCCADPGAHAPYCPHNPDPHATACDTCDDDGAQASTASLLAQAAEALAAITSEARTLVQWPGADNALRILATARAVTRGDLAGMRRALASMREPLAAAVAALEAQGWGECYETETATAAVAAIDNATAEGTNDAG